MKAQNLDPMLISTVQQIDSGFHDTVGELSEALAEAIAAITPDTWLDPCLEAFFDDDTPVVLKDFIGQIAVEYATICPLMVFEEDLRHHKERVDELIEIVGADFLLSKITGRRIDVQ